METRVSVAFLLFASVFGVLASGDSNVQDPVVLHINIPDDYGNIITFQYVPSVFVPNISVSEYPNLISFYLYTRDTKNNPEKLYIDDVKTLKQSHFDSNKSTVFITHGWTNSYESPASTLVRDAYLQYGDYNAILIDWVNIAEYEYMWVTEQIVKVSQFIARLIDFLASQGMDLSKVTNVGHSLGAHIAGLSSYYAKNKVKYVVGMDPAGPLMRIKGKESRLSPDDATYVQAIHTSSIIGLTDELGHSDFYVNGALPQNGCKHLQPCTHIRGFEYFAESINNNGFLARKCDSFVNFELGNCNSNPVAYMGGANLDLNAKGRYYLTTNAHPPFAKGPVDRLS